MPLYLRVNAALLEGKCRTAFCANGALYSGAQDCAAPNGLFVIADAAAQIADPGHEAHLRRWGFVGTRPYPHVADLSDLTFRLLIRVVEFLAKRLAGDVL
jgi:hypothetical protein